MGCDYAKLFSHTFTVLSSIIAVVVLALHADITGTEALLVIVGVSGISVSNIGPLSGHVSPAVAGPPNA